MASVSPRRGATGPSSSGAGALGLGGSGEAGPGHPATLAGVSVSDAPLVSETELERHLDNGLRHVRDLFDQQNHHVQHWKHVAAQQKQQIAQLSAHASRLEQHVAEIERQNAVLLAEKAALISSREELVGQYAMLRKRAVQLNAFRENIVNMVETGPARVSDVGLGAAHDPAFGFPPEIERSLLAAPTSDAIESHPTATPSSKSHGLGMGRHPALMPHHPSPSQQGNSAKTHQNQGQNQHQTPSQHQGQDGFPQDMFGSDGESSGYVHHSALTGGPDRSMRSFELGDADLDALSDPDASGTGRSSAEPPNYGASGLPNAQARRASGPPGPAHGSLAMPGPLPAGHGHLAQNDAESSGPEARLSPSHSPLPSPQTADDRLLGLARSMPLPGNSASETAPQASGGAGAANGSHAAPGRHGGHNGSGSPAMATGGGGARSGGGGHGGGNARLSMPAHPVAGRGTAEPSSSAAASSAASSFTIDAPTLYKQIRQTLAVSQFEAFAANVAAFNASQQTAEETVANIGRIVRDRHLFGQMRTLIYTALAESSREA
ncbi:hypothetical protein CXG81DRAFT_16977 [Caulochytrium protostelioides]|uniref:At4g15545-like C-terminal domain-containing protein n=1 Tax=Caulochytrium protostelioides TaxID=1555241 RepID=A0A4P9XDD4_9FUNG|nr:hypothetical protein CXG81DRAFT_16977 [Caulochytrium protostelioides]|eukprot:RKP03468.1 hypothetical protein CXG81DRAFT_16977 [Caulochytrium protostelioides]